MAISVAPAAGIIALSLLWCGALTAFDHARLVQQGRGRRGSDTEQSALSQARLAFHVVIVSLAVLLGEQARDGAGAALAALMAWLAIALLTSALPKLLAQHQPARFQNAGPLLWLPTRLAAPTARLQQKLFNRPSNLGTAAHNTTGRQVQRPSHLEREGGTNDTRAAKQGVAGGILGLERMTVNDILVPRHEVDGLDLNDPIEQIIDQLMISRHTRLPVFRGDINQVDKVINTRQISHLLPSRGLTADALMAACYEAYFIPESTPLHTQLLNFHKQQRRLGMVVDEYGEVLGLVTLEDILEEIVGEFESESTSNHPHVFPQADGRYILDGAASLRDLNKVLGWHLPSDGPKTLNGLVTEALESIPARAVCLKIGHYRLEILETEENRVKRLLAWQHVPAEPAA
jgi:Mg2+/Co2+ transporter CorB